MRARRIIEGAAFGPEVLDVVKAAFEAAWTLIADKFAASEHEDAREALARAVMTAAREDSTDPTPIRDAGVRAMAQRYPSRFGGSGQASHDKKIV